ncbi:hypothetical protein MCEGE10_00432 [Flavobacteriaceae bacterium]
MKKINFNLIIPFLGLILSTSLVNGQIRANNVIATNISGESAFLDASGATGGFSDIANSNIGKGLIFSRTDLNVFTFISPDGDEDNYPTAYDGMVVFNTGSGTTPLLGSGIGSQLITPGFYYFSNPTPTPDFSSASGQWIQLGSNVKNYTTTPIKTATSIDGAQVWAVKGSFSVPYAPTLLVPNPTYVSTAVVSIPKPDGITGYTKMTTYQGGKTFRSDISSLTIDPLDLLNVSVVTGNGLFSEVYPGGDYTYTLEYFK